jgi:hypothetical protein
VLTKSKKHKYEATDPKRVWDKFRDCQQILCEMRGHEEAKDTDKLMRSLSAFLSEFRTTTNRLIGVVKNQHGEMAGTKLWKQIKTHSEIRFLIDRANEEIHGDGALVWPRFRIDVPLPMRERWPSKLSVARWRTERWTPKWPTAPRVVKEVNDWRFQQRPENIVALCGHALLELENLIRQALA